MHTGPTTERGQRVRLLKIGFVLATVLAAALLTTGAAADGTPTIASDAADYAPGDRATLIGTNWGSGEAVQILVRGSDGTMYADVERAADESGRFEYIFTLPDWFVESFTAEATGSSGATASTSFTDSNVTLSPTPINASVAAGATTTVTITTTKVAQGPTSNPVINSLTTPGGAANTCFANTGAVLPSSWLSITSPALPFTMIGANGTTQDFTVQVAPPSATPAGNYRTRVSFNVTSNTGSANDVHLCVVVAADSTAPVGSISISGGASHTNSTSVTLNLQATDAVGVTAYRFANGSDCSGASYSSVASTTSLATNIAHTLTSGDGTKTVCAQYRDAAGNQSATYTDAIVLDTTSPAVSCGSADGAWHAADVSIACTASDGGSGLASSGDASFNLTTSVAAGTEDANASTNSHAVLDAVGNSTTAGPVSANKVDKKAPAVSCGSADGAWHAADVSIACTASDGGSGLASSGDASFNLTTSVAAGTEDANASTNSHAVLDAVGNSTTAGPVSANKVDKKAPAVSCGSADGAWHAADVSIACTASDGGSGLASSGDASFNLTTSVAAGTEDANASTNSHAVLDAVGNSTTAGPVSANKVDKKAPELSSCDAPDGLWHSSNVTLQCHYTDGGSGPATQDVDLTTNVAAGTETANASASANGAQACDAVGNCAASPADIAGNKIDRKDQSSRAVTHRTASGTRAMSRCSATTRTAAPGRRPRTSTLTTNVAAGTETANASASANGAQACDAVGNCAASPADIAGNKIDRKAPAVSCGSADGAWHPADVSIACTASDGGSGLASSGDASFNLTTSVAAGTEDANASTNSHAVLDAVGNSTTAGPVSANKVDKKAPAVSCGSADGAWHAADVSIACTASDGGSGLASSGDASFNLTTSVAAGTEDANASTNSHAVLDAVGNSTTAGPVSGNKVDKKAPELSSCDAPDGLWHSSNVTLQCHYTDGGSGPATQDVDLTTNVAAGTEMRTPPPRRTEPKLATRSATLPPRRPNRRQQGRPQGTEFSSCDAPDGLWHSSNVTLQCHYTDGGFGPATQDVNLTTDVAAGTETANASASANGAQACDAVGNCAASPADIAGNKVDRKVQSSRAVTHRTASGTRAMSRCSATTRTAAPGRLPRTST